MMVLLSALLMVFGLRFWPKERQHLLYMGHTVSHKMQLALVLLQPSS